MAPEELSVDGNPIKEALARKRIEELRALAKDQGVDISGLNHKRDIIDVLALQPGIANVLGVSSEGSSDVPSLDDILSGGQSESTPATSSFDPTPVPTVSREESPRHESHGPKSIEDLLQESLATTVDFSRMQSLLAEAGAKFQARNYDNVLSLSKDSVMGIDEVTRRYLKSAWGYAISASLKILEDSDRDSDSYRKAHDVLADAKKVFQSHSYITDNKLLDKLHRAVTDLYNYEIQKARQHIQAQEAVLEQIQAMGGDTTKASEILGKAAEALMGNNRAHYLEVITKADDMVTQARNARIAEIRAAFANVEDVIKEAKAIGADVTESLQLHEQARASIQAGDFVNANRLIQRTERVALEAQKAQIDRVTELHRRQVEKVKKLIVDTKPLLEKARSKGMDTTKAMDLMRQAVDCVNRGDYVNGLLHVKEAAEAIKSVVPAEEMPKEGRVAAASRGFEAPEPPEESVMDLPSEPASSILEGSVPSPPPVEAAGGGPSPEGGKSAPRCPSCGSPSIELRENGKGRCFQCGAKFKWGRR
jgi:hypothetical protein